MGRPNTEEARELRRQRYREGKGGEGKASMYAWRKANPEKWKAICRQSYERNKDRVHAYHRAYYLKQREILAGRPKPDVCECCDEKSKIVWDHQHDNGEFRGWICDRCNRVLGAIKDNPVILEQLIRYLRENSRG